MVEQSIPEEDQTAEFVSKLGGGRQRFLAHVIEQGLAAGRRTPADFIRHFPPAQLMEALRRRPDLRARILGPTTGIKERIAEKKSVESSAEDLQLALDLGETDAETIVALMAADDRVRYLDHQALWAYVSEGEFWKATDGIDFEIARAHVSYILERAMGEALLTPRALSEGLGIERLSELLPREELGRLVMTALERGRERKPFRDEDLLEAVPLPVLTEYVPLELLWDAVVIRRIAEVHGFAEVAEGPPPPHTEPLSSDEDVRFDFEDESTVTGEHESLTAAPSDGE